MAKIGGTFRFYSLFPAIQQKFIIPRMRVDFLPIQGSVSQKSHSLGTKLSILWERMYMKPLDMNALVVCAFVDVIQDT